MILIVRSGRALLLCAAITLVSAAASARPAEAPAASVEVYRTWLAEKAGRAADVRAFELYLAHQGVGGVFPTYQLLRSESSWAQFGRGPLSLAPRAVLPQVV